MPAITRRPSVVEEAVDQFAALFANKCQRKHFGNHLTGLMVGRNKTVTGITSEIVDAKDQSCLNRFLTEVDWDVKELNEQRIQWLQQSLDLQFHRKGVIALDNVLVDHSGKLIEDVGWLGRRSHYGRLSGSLDGHGNFSSGRKATVLFSWANGGLSAS